MAEKTDEELVESILAGQEDDFRILVLRYQQRVANYLTRILRNQDEAIEVSQEVFLRVYRALDRFDASYRFSTWLFRVAQNAAIDLMRKRRLKLVSLHRPETGDSEGGDWEFASDDQGPYGDLRNRERGSAILTAVAALKGEYRELVELRHFAEMSYDEIAELKEMPLGTVKNKLFRGRQMLKEQLEEFLSD